ncbi:hypothetical protein [Phenylobacterium sp.]|uniref:hypothetical protein n=1 Tax=Phenylobacterium sp. TaxID=1871053 RepID=UPI00260B21B2|nr:hypothetical protein [Phenylobacterium sp.]
MNKPKPKPDNPEQSKRFIDAAKEAGVDERGKNFERAFKKIVPSNRRSQTKPAS